MDFDEMLKRGAKPLGKWAEDLNSEQKTALLWARTTYSTYPKDSDAYKSLSLIAILMDKLDKATHDNP